MCKVLDGPTNAVEQVDRHVAVLRHNRMTFFFLSSLGYCVLLIFDKEFQLCKVVVYLLCNKLWLTPFFYHWFKCDPVFNYEPSEEEQGQLNFPLRNIFIYHFLYIDYVKKCYHITDDPTFPLRCFTTLLTG